MKKVWKTLFCFCSFLSFSASAQSENVEQSARLNLTSCHVDGIRQQVECGKLEVPENYKNPNEAKLEVNVVVLPALDDSQKQTPMMFLAGGPGQAAAQMAGMINRMFFDVRKTRDIILIDQRGTGESSPLSCDHLAEADPYTFVFADATQQEVLDCIATFDVDLSHYSSPNAIRDFEQVRESLGLEQISLYGGSYGTRAALVYMNMFPQSIEAVVLDSVGPVEVPIGAFGQSSARSFSLLLENCKSNEACHKAFPDLEQEFQTLLERVQADPIEVSIMHPTLGTSTSLVIDHSKLISTIRLQLYSMEGRTMVPLVIHQAFLGNYAPMAGLISRTASQDSSQMFTGLTLNIVCNEDLPRIKLNQLQADADNQFGQAASHDFWLYACPSWPKFEPEIEFFKSVTANIPTLILSGNLDPVTPPSNGDYSDKSLPNSRHITVKNASHIVATSPCAIGLINEFLVDKDPQAIDEKCLTEIDDERFMTSLNGTI